MEGALAPLLVSTGVVAVAEMGDKTQLLALVLAARFRRPWPIVLGILVATLANHAVEPFLGFAASMLVRLLLLGRILLWMGQGNRRRHGQRAQEDDDDGVVDHGCERYP